MKCWGVERRKRVVEQKERLEAERETHVDYSHVELRYVTPGLFHEALFDPSMMVHFRKRFPVNEVAQINEYLCTGKRPDGMRDVDRNKTSEQDEEEGDVKSQDDDNHLPPASINEGAKESSGKKKGKHRNCTSKKKEKRKKGKKNRGKLIMDATVAPADITYPTDIGLLNKSRENLETAINVLWKAEYGERKKQTMKSIMVPTASARDLAICKKELLIFINLFLYLLRKLILPQHERCHYHQRHERWSQNCHVQNITIA